MKKQPASHNLKCKEMCGKGSLLNEESHEPGVELHSYVNGVGMEYHNDDRIILAKRDIHPSERNRVVMVPTGNITIASCDDPGGHSKKENRELVINGTRYWNTDGLTMKRSKANRVGLRYRDEGWITIYEWNTHPPEDKTEYEMEERTIFISTWKPWDPENSRNDDVTEEESTNDEELVDKDYWWEQYYRKKDTTVGVPNNHQDDRDEVVLVPTSVITIISCDDPGGHGKKTNRELMSSGTRHGDMDGLIDGRSDVSGGELGCHEDGRTITDDSPDKDKMEDEMKGGTVVMNARKLWAPGYKKWWQRTNTLKKLMIAYVDVIAKLIHCTMMIIVMMILITNETVSKSECAGIVRYIGSISRKAGGAQKDGGKESVKREHNKGYN
ncbi:2428_t:CDS:1 [Acaulospora morrowiae]|uniref:2428_t:CDS:1 n=1 Tax=Acaulospora morrowiae TaxID=94023 RepID=A0A9N9GU07_9GLOM|nr:2428_t:CDS:1 [Acaulospora morrowiae]